MTAPGPMTFIALRAVNCALPRNSATSQLGVRLCRGQLRLARGRIAVGHRVSDSGEQVCTARGTGPVYSRWLNRAPSASTRGNATPATRRGKRDDSNDWG